MASTDTTAIEAVLGVDFLAVVDQLELTVTGVQIVLKDALPLSDEPAEIVVTIKLTSRIQPEFGCDFCLVYPNWTFSIWNRLNQIYQQLN